jgi:hypothetical protein
MELVVEEKYYTQQLENFNIPFRFYCFHKVRDILENFEHTFQNNFMRNNRRYFGWNGSISKSSPWNLYMKTLPFNQLVGDGVTQVQSHHPVKKDF